MTADGAILVVNSDPSSTKFALFDLASDEPRRRARLLCTRTVMWIRT